MTAGSESSSAGTVIVGGGVIGCSVAYHLRLAGYEDRIVIVERDSSYRQASSRLAFGGIRQQYATEVNARMAQRSVAFYRRFEVDMAVEGRPAIGRFRSRGYLFLANAANAAALESRFQRMRAIGVDVEKADHAAMRHLVPEMRLDDVLFGLFGPQDGYGDPIGVLAGFRSRVASLGVEILEGELEEIATGSGRVAGVSVGSIRIATGNLVCAAGAYSRRVGELAGVSIPVSPVRQQLVRAQLPRPWSYEFPVVIDPTGVHWRSSEYNSIVIARTDAGEPEGEHFVPDEDRLGALLPALAHRVPEFAGLTAVQSWAGLYEMTEDHNGLMGEHPGLAGLYLACGFSGHGLMLAPATGEITAALLMGKAPFEDVSELSVDRFRTGKLFRDEAML